MISIQRVSLALGARVTGLDLSRDVSEEDWGMVLRAFHEYSLLIFPGQDLTVEQLKRFGGKFGPLDVNDHLLPVTVEGHPECMVLHNNAEKPPGLNSWHTDNSGWPKPPLGTVLHAKITPPIGGDTMFSNMYAAFEALSAPMREFLAGLSGIHDVKKAFGPKYAELQRSLAKKGIDADENFAHHGVVEHPLVRVHPETLKKAIYVSGPYLTGVKDLSRREGEALLQFLYRHIETNEFVYRHAWSEGDLLIWDNRCTQHLAVADYYPQERLMHRLNIAGEKPAGAS